MRPDPKRRGLTLVELIVVLAILVALAGLLVPLLSSTSSKAQDTTTQATMIALRNAVIAYHQDMKGIQVWNDGSVAPPGATGMPLTLRDLQIPPLVPDGSATVQRFDPVTRRGWRGPYMLQTTGTFLPPPPPPPSPGAILDTSFYPAAPAGYPSFPSYTLSSLFGNTGDPTFVDGWGNPIVLQWPSAGQGDPSNSVNDVVVRSQYVRLVSAGAPSQFVPANGQTVSVLDTVTTTLTTGAPLPLMPLPSQRITGDPNAIDPYAHGKDYILFILTQDLHP
jgi:prepilin-type N-terminal cleavage/methylation domain-containing protein